MSTNLDFLERPGCHLCEAALPLVERLAGRLDASLTRIDIESDDRLVAEFALRIPVVRLNGTVIAEGTIEYKSMLKAARELRRA